MSTHEQYLLSGSRHESGTYGKLLEFINDDNNISRSADMAPPGNEEIDAHYDLISFLSIVQKRKVDLMPITWQPGLGIVGEGATAKVHQSQLNLEASPAFKRTRFASSSQPDSEAELRMFRALAAEISILGHPAIKEHPNIIKLEGICWEVDEKEEKVWPVLVFEKAEFGDLYHFMASEGGKKMSFADRLELCISIGSAVMIMHECHVIHGDIKPNNILVFKDSAGRLVPRVSDFGYSTLVATTEQEIFLPKSEPWNAPECHHRRTDFLAAKKADVYSFGVLCLWILFKENISEVELEDSKGIQIIHDFLSFKAVLGQLKMKDKMVKFAHSLTARSRGLNKYQRNNLCQLFSISLVSDLESRNSSFVLLLQLLEEDSTTVVVGALDMDQEHSRLQLLNHILTAALKSSTESIPGLLRMLKGLDEERGRTTQALGSDEENVLAMHIHQIHFDISRSLFGLCSSDYRVRKYLAQLSKLRAQNSPCEHCRAVSALQISFCYEIGFGIRRNQHESLFWLAKSSKTNLKDEMQMAQSLPDITYQRAGLSKSLYEHGFLDSLTDYGNAYLKSQDLQKVKANLRAEIDDMQSNLGSSSHVVHMLKHVLATVLVENGELQEALETWEEVRQRIPEATNNLGLGIVLSNIGLALYLQGKNRQAEEKFNQAREIIEKLLGRDHPLLLNIVGNLGLILVQQGKYGEAEEQYRSLLQKSKNLYGTGNIQNLMFSANYATNLIEQGKFYEAEGLLSEALRGWENTAGEDNSHTLHWMHLTANVFRDQGRYDAAERLYYRLLNGCERVFGEKHPATLNAAGDLSSCLMEEGKYNQAEDMLQRALDEFDSSVEKFPKMKILGTYNQGRLHHLKGNFEIAEKLVQKAAEMCRDVNGIDHPETLAITGTLAQILQERGKYKAAEEMYRRVVKDKETILGKDHPSTLTTLGNLGFNLDLQGQNESAERIQRRVLEAEEKIFKENHPSILMSCNNLGMSLYNLGRFAESETFIRRALNGKEKVFGEDHPSTLNSYDNLGSVLGAQQKYKLSEEMHVRALEGFEKKMGNNHPRTLSCMVNIALTLMGQRKYMLAKDMLIKVLKGRAEALGMEHPDTQSCVAELNSLFRVLAMTETTEWGLRDLGREWEKVLGPYGVHPDMSNRNTANNFSIPENEPSPDGLVPKGFRDISNAVKISQVDLRGSISDFGCHLFDETNAANLSKPSVPPVEIPAESYVVSHVDEQLMLFVPFRRKVKVHSIHITSRLHTSDNDETIIQPTSIKLFKNMGNILEFSEADQYQDVQQFRIADTSWDKETSTTILSLNYVKFQDVFDLVIFVNGLSLEEDMEENVFTRLDRIRIIGN